MVVGIGTLRIGFQMHGDGAARVIVDDLDRVAAAHEGIAIVKLHNHRWLGVTEEGVPRCLTGGGAVIQRGEFNVVVVIAGDHAVWRKFVGQFVKEVD